jgi:3-carboxy-cis,cis-muconate cycloisomerase
MRPFMMLESVFGDPEMGEIFSEAAFVEAWLAVERALAASQAELGVIPDEAALAIADAAVADRIDLGSLWAATENVGYPIVPLIDQITEGAPDIVRAYLHWGATTQDIMDTGLALQLGRGLRLVTARVLSLGGAISVLMDSHARAVMPARTHGQQAVPTTFGLKLAVWLEEIGRHVRRLSEAREAAAVVQLFGAAGTAAALGSKSSETRRLLAERLRLTNAHIPWHAARDNLAEVGFVVAAIAASCGKIAREVIELSRTEIGEVSEMPASRHGESSTMPQKVNPVVSEAVVGMSISARHELIGLLVAMQGVHERSAGEWQVEWDSLPSLFTLTAGCVRHTTAVLESLEVRPTRMRANLDADGGAIMAEAAMMALAPHIGRLSAHELVGEACCMARESGATLGVTLSEMLDDDLKGMLPPIPEILNPDSHLGEAEAVVEAAREGWRLVKADIVPDWDLEDGRTVGGRS